MNMLLCQRDHDCSGVDCVPSVFCFHCPCNSLQYFDCKAVCAADRNFVYFSWHICVQSFSDIELKLEYLQRLACYNCTL